jgi:hypothetical protein
MQQSLSENGELALWLVPNQIFGLGNTFFCQLLAEFCPQIYLFSASSSQLGVVEIGEFSIPRSNRSRISNECHLLIQQSAKLVEKSADILIEVLLTIKTISPFGSLAQSGRNLVYPNAILGYKGFDDINFDTEGSIRG